MSMDNRTGRRFGRKPYEPSPFKAYEAAASGETSYTAGPSDNEYNLIMCLGHIYLEIHH